MYNLDSAYAWTILMLLSLSLQSVDFFVHRNLCSVQYFILTSINPYSLVVSDFVILNVSLVNCLNLQQFLGVLCCCHIFNHCGLVFHSSL